MLLSFHPIEIWIGRTLTVTQSVPGSADVHQKVRLSILPGTRSLGLQLRTDKQAEVLDSDEFGPKRNPSATEVRTINEINWNPRSQAVVTGCSELERKADLLPDGCDMRVFQEGFERNAALTGHLTEIEHEVFVEAGLVLQAEVEPVPAQLQEDAVRPVRPAELQQTSHSPRIPVNRPKEDEVGEQRIWFSRGDHPWSGSCATTGFSSADCAIFGLPGE